MLLWKFGALRQDAQEAPHCRLSLPGKKDQSGEKIKCSRSSVSNPERAGNSASVVAPGAARSYGTSSGHKERLMESDVDTRHARASATQEQAQSTAKGKRGKKRKKEDKEQESEGE